MNESESIVSKHPPHFKDMTGRRFGKLVVIGYAYTRKRNGSSKGYWKCKCDCGNTHITFGGYLRTGDTRSCGCAKASSIVLLGTRAKQLPEWRTWRSMISRCASNSREKDRKHYSDRGIFVCDRWKESFLNFFQDMGKRPDGHSLDRIDNNGPYSPENCRWSTRCQQNRNKRTNRMVTLNGVTKCLIEWEEEYGLRRSIFWLRKKAGWSDEKAITTPMKPFRPRRQK